MDAESWPETWVEDSLQLRNDVMCAVVKFSKTDKIPPKAVATVLANLSAFVAEVSGCSLTEWVAGNDVVAKNVWKPKESTCRLSAYDLMAKIANASGKC